MADTSKYGLILRDERWSGEVKITGEIWSLPGTTVTVDPGTKILVATSRDKFTLHWLPWQIKSGLNTGKDQFRVKNGELYWDEQQKIQLHFAKLLVWGTKEQPVQIISDTPRPGSPFDFNVIAMDGGILSHVKMGNYRRFEVGDNVTIRDSEFTNVGECAVCTDYTSPSVINNVFQNSLRAYINVTGGNPKINDNLFLLSFGEGIVIDPRKLGAPLVYHNTFEMPQSVALRFLSGGKNSGGAVSLNIFAGGTTIVLPCDSRVKIIQNEIGGVIKLSSGSCVGSLTLDPNYWFSSDRQAILQEKIVGKEAQFKVLLPAVLFNSPNEVGRRTD